MGIVAGLEEQGLDLLCDRNLSEPQVSKKDKAEGMKWGSLERREMTVAIMGALASCLRQSSHSGAIVSVTASCCRIVEIVLTIALVQIVIIDECFTARCVCSSSPSPAHASLCVQACLQVHRYAQRKLGPQENDSPPQFCSVILNALHRAHGGLGDHAVCQFPLPSAQGSADAQTPVLQVCWQTLHMDRVEDPAKNSLLTLQWVGIGGEGCSYPRSEVGTRELRIEEPSS